MKIIIKSFLKDKSIKRYLLIYFSLLVLLLVLYNFKVGLSSYTKDLRNNIDYRTIIVKLKDGFKYQELKKVDYILSVDIDDIETNENNLHYKIILKEEKYIKTFINDYNEVYTSILYDPFVMPKMLKIFNVSLTVLTIIFITTISIMLILNIIETILSRKQEVSFYKLIGYKNIDIIKMLSSFLILIYTILYFISNIFSIILSIIIKKILIHINFKFNLVIFSVSFSLIMYIVIILIILIILCICYSNIKKRTPIDFIRNT